MRVGIEVGGTFTDLVLADGDELRIAKVPSTPEAPDRGAATFVLDRAGDKFHQSAEPFDVDGVCFGNKLVVWDSMRLTKKS